MFSRWSSNPPVFSPLQRYARYRTSPSRTTTDSGTSPERRRTAASSPSFQPLPLAVARVAAKKDTGGCEHFVKGAHDPPETPLDGGGTYLQHQIIAVAVHDEAGHAVAFGVEQPAGVGIYLQRLAVGESPRYAGSEPGLLYGLVAAFDDAECDLALGIVEAASEEVAFAVEYGHYVAKTSPSVSATSER